MSDGGARAAAAGLAASAASVALTLAVAAAGPSVMEPALPGGNGWPPWTLAARLSPYLVTGLAAAALAAGAAGLALCLRAAHRGWTASPRLLLAAGIAAAAALALTPPFGSSDHLSYAAYGRMAVTGHDPYTTTPAMLASLGDPVARAVQDWRGSPSVYGSLATGGQALSSLVGGSSVARTVFALSVLNLLAFAGTGLILHRLARPSRRAQFRAALLWTANPLLLGVLVAGEHVDSQAVVFGAAAVAIFAAAARPGRQGARGGPRRFALSAAAGAAAGLGFAVKVSLLLIPAGLALGAALAWRQARGSGERSGAAAGAAAAGLAVGFGLTSAAALVPWGLQTLRPALRAGSYVSVGSPWRGVRAALRLAVGAGPAGDAVKAGAVALMAMLAVLLARRLAGRPGRRAPGQPPPDPAAFAVSAAFILVFSWLLAWPYVLPWYDALAWALLAMLPWRPPTAPPRPGRAGPGLPPACPPAERSGLPAERSGLPAAALDWLLLARTAALSFAYLPARGITMPAGLSWLRPVFRSGVAPVVLLAITVALAVLLWPRRARGAPPARAGHPPAAGIMEGHGRPLRIPGARGDLHRGRARRVRP